MIPDSCSNCSKFEGSIVKNDFTNAQNDEISNRVNINIFRDCNIFGYYAMWSYCSKYEDSILKNGFTNAQNDKISNGNNMYISSDFLERLYLEKMASGMLKMTKKQ